MGWGGKRPNSGRKRNPVKKRNRGFQLTDAEYVLVKKFVDEVRKKSAENAEKKQDHPSDHPVEHDER